MADCSSALDAMQLQLQWLVKQAEADQAVAVVAVGFIPCLGLV